MHMYLQYAPVIIYFVPIKRLSSVILKCSTDYHQQLPSENFELDLAEEERLAQISVS